ncbi:MAG: DUF58 domain-containing protein [Chloroflexi bacterium]|nr:DUF58 domain-containing protein [Chloroflexota bacterium]
MAWGGVGVENGPLPSIDFLGKKGLILMLAIAGVGAWADRPALVFLALVALCVALVAFLWSRYALRGLECHVKAPEQRAFPGETIRVEVAVENRKLLPLTWLRVRGALPRGLAPVADGPAWRLGPRTGFVEGVTGVGPFGRAWWTFDVRCRARGAHEVGPIEAASGDPFGLTAQRDIIPERVEILVYPRIVPLRRLGLTFADGIGAVQRARSLLEDPTRPAGLREYRPGDPPARVHWKTSARTDRLQVAVPETAAVQRVLLLLACDSFDYPWDRYRGEIFELTVTAVASIAWWACAQGWHVGLVSNGEQPGLIAPSAAPDQTVRILEALARQEPTSRPPFKLLERPEAHSRQAATYICAAGKSTKALTELLTGVRHAGHRTLLVYTGPEGTSPAVRGVTTHQLRVWDDLATTLEDERAAGQRGKRG